MKDRILPIWLLLFALVLAGCRDKEPEQERIGITNYFLPDVEAFNKAYFSEKEPEPEPEPENIEQEEKRWKPYGAFSVTYSDRFDKQLWTTAHFKISSVDLEKKTAVLTYMVNDNRDYVLAQQAGKTPRKEDYFFSSGGRRALFLDETESSDGARCIRIYLTGESFLEFTGKDHLGKARFCCNGVYYRLKSEG